jgi:hypothetical protein
VVAVSFLMSLICLYSIWHSRRPMKGFFTYGHGSISLISYGWSISLSLIYGTLAKDSWLVAFLDWLNVLYTNLQAYFMCLENTNAAAQAQVFYSTVQDCTLSLNYLHPAVAEPYSGRDQATLSSLRRAVYSSLCTANLGLVIIKYKTPYWIYITIPRKLVFDYKK